MGFRCFIPSGKSSCKTLVLVLSYIKVEEAIWRYSTVLSETARRRLRELSNVLIMSLANLPAPVMIASKAPINPIYLLARRYQQEGHYKFLSNNMY